MGSSPDKSPEELGKLFDDPCVGELSVTWNRNLRRWLMTYNCGQTLEGTKVVARSAETPWGPWSDPACSSTRWPIQGTATSCTVMGVAGRPDDPASPADPKLDRVGGVYAPYVIQRYTRGGAQTTTLYYVMSTWNPYQVMLMRTTLAAPHPLPFGPDTCKPGFVCGRRCRTTMSVWRRVPAP